MIFVQGLDSFSPVHMNFGERPFLFDVFAYEATQLSEPMLGSSWNKYIEWALHQESLGVVRRHILYKDPSTRPHYHTWTLPLRIGISWLRAADTEPWSPLCKRQSVSSRGSYTGTMTSHRIGQDHETRSLFLHPDFKEITYCCVYDPGNFRSAARVLTVLCDSTLPITQLLYL